MNTKPHQPARGFTLIEILIVVVILGILASLVIIQINNAAEDAERAAFINSGQIFVEAAKRYQLTTGNFPNDAPSGQLPWGFGDFVTSHHWEGLTPIGGRWDAEANSYGVTSMIGVDFRGPYVAKDDAYMQKIHAAIDDGDLTTGSFRKVASQRFYFTVAP